MKASRIKEVFSAIDIDLNDLQVNQLITYFDLLVEWNEKMNLTAITDDEGVLIKHFADSVISSRVIDYTEYESLIDVGTGAGFPGVPLKIVYPHLQVTLMDALNKRILFLNEVIGQLALEGIEAIHDRAEVLARTDHREAYDLCVSRAVSQLNILCEYCMPFIKVGGYFVSYKGSKTMEELDESKHAIEVLGGKLNQVTDQVSLTDEIKRGFVIIDKVTSTDDKYPRRPGKPQKKPL